MSDNQRLLIQLKIAFLTKSIDGHVAEIKQAATNNGVSDKEALKTWKSVAKKANLSKDKVRAVERHF